MSGTLRLWVEVSDPAEIEEMRRLGVCEAYVLRSPERPYYGRPGDTLYVRLSEAEVAGPLQPLSYRVPRHVGVIVPASQRGLVALKDLRRRGRERAAAEVRTPAELLLVGAAGVEYVLVDGQAAEAIVRQAGGRPPWVVAEVRSLPEVGEAMRAGAAAVLVSSRLLRELVSGEGLGALTTAPAPMADPTSPVARVPTGSSTAARPAVHFASEPPVLRAAGSPHPDTVAGLLERSAVRFGAGLALVHHARKARLTYRELRAQSRSLARGLLALGVRRGDRVAVMARNIPEWPVIQFGSAYLGAVLVTVNSSSTAEELHYFLSQSGSRLLFAQAPEMLEAAAGALATGLPELSWTVTIGAGRLPADLSWEQLLAQGRVVSEADLDHAAAALAPEDVINIQYTSGTTGRAKGAMLTHLGMLMNARAVGAGLRLSSADRLCLPVPFFHCFGCVLGTLAAVTYGSALVVPADWFSADQTLAAVRSERCTVLHGVPTMFQAELDALRQAGGRLTSLRTGIVAGSPVSPDLMQRISAEMHIPQLTIAYGLTEASPVVTQTPIDAPRGQRFGSVGVAIPGAEVRIVDPETGREAAVGTPGELCTRGPMVMQGYFGMPAETAEAIDREGWLHTGDLATVDAAGYYRIVGRLKDMIIRGGENIYPAEVEAVLERHPAVRQAAVAGIPSEFYGEEVGAWVILREGAAAGAQELREFVTQHLAPFKVPKEIYLVSELPVTGSGKVRKGELVRGAEAIAHSQMGRLRAVASMAAREDPQLAVQSTAPQLAHAPQASLPPRPDVTRPAPPSSQRLPLPLLGPKPRVGVETSGAMAPAPRPVPLPRSTASAQPDGRGRHGAPGWPQPDQPRWIWNSAGAGGRIHRPSEPDRPGSANRIHPASAAAHPAAANRIHPALAPDHPGAPGPLNPPTAPQQKEITVDTDIRRRGTRIKEWGIQGDIEEAIESTGEHPIMYRALGTPPQSGHPFNLYFDIRSQPQALAETFQHADEVVRVAEEMARRDIWGVLGLGSGTSQFVAQVVGAALSRFAGLPAWDADSLAYRQYPPPYDFKKLAVIAYSGSGSTVDTVAAAQDATNAGAFTVAFTSVDGSPVVKATDMRVLTAGGFDTGGSDTFHYTTRLAAGILLALELGKRRHPNAHPYDRLKRELLDTAARMGESFDRVDARCQSIARDLHRVRSILIVGGGANCGTAEEIALKFDEMAHIPAKGMSPGRHIHGALGLTDEEILTLLVAPPGICYDELESIAEVTQILKTPSVALVSENDDRIAKMVDYVIRLPVEDETIFSVLAVLPGQLIPYWCGVNLGLNPDTQRSNVPKHARVWNMLFPAGTH